ncbi:MAG TPA: NupC/NupG family nucleoside CNT transporter [Rubrobacter sp.]|nr:NupC/NupG family nucleoside CNT transporter [Rubrobacter sp.]
MQVLWGIGGMVVLLAIAFGLSTNRRAINPRTVFGALAIQILIGVIALYWQAGRRALEAASNAVQAVIDSSNEGIEFLFGPVLPEEGLVFAFQVLPVIIFFAALTSVLYHWGVLQWIVKLLGGALQFVLRTSKAESTFAASTIFVGMSEAPLVVKPYIARATRSELFTMMGTGLATVAGSLLVGYSLLGVRLEYLLAAAFMAGPAGIVMSKIIVPETGQPETLVASNVDEEAEEAEEEDEEDDEEGHLNTIDAIASGTLQGLQIALTVGAMLIAFISLIALVNIILGAAGGLFGFPDLTFELILGYVFAPLAFLIGVPWQEAVSAGSFLGQKLVLNEFVAFSNFGPQVEQFSQKTVAIVTFGLTGFANFGSIAILIGTFGSISPSRRHEVARFGIRAVLAGTLANLMNATIAGILIG